jgi:tetratricopeptide (TPR) repeat protein
MPLVAAWSVLIVGGGCNRSSSSAETNATGPVEAPDAISSMTTEQREQGYQATYQAGVDFAAKGQYALALQAFEQALALKPTSVDALFNLGACHEAIGDPLRAINIYRRVLETYPDDPDCYTNLGTSFIKMYHRDRSPTWRKMARDAWQRSLSLNPNQPRVKQYLAQSESFD